MERIRRLGLGANTVEAVATSSKTYKALWYLLVFVILSLIVAIVIVLYVPFIQTNPYGFPTTAMALVVVNVIAAVLIKKGVVPKPTLRERKLNLLLLAIVLIVTFAVAFLWGMFGHASLLGTL